MDRAGLRMLIERLEKLKIATGFIKVYRLEYSTKPAVIGEGTGSGVDDENAFIV